MLSGILAECQVDNGSDVVAVEKTDAAGIFKARGFLGDYEIEASAGGKTARQTWALKKQGAPLEITLQ